MICNSAIQINQSFPAQTMSISGESVKLYRSCKAHIRYLLVRLTRINQYAHFDQCHEYIMAGNPVSPAGKAIIRSSLCSSRITVGSYICKM